MRLLPNGVLMSREHLRPLWPLGAALLAWALIFAAVPPAAQEFPLNDDWAYSKGAFAFVRGEGVHYFRQPSMPLLGQWLLSYPVVRIVGESHTALRLSTIGLSLVGTLAFYDLLRQKKGLGAWEASFTAAALALNPLYFLMSGTFMSDVPALALSLASLASYHRALRGGRRGWLVVGAILAALAIANRQNALVSPIVGGVLLMGDCALRRRISWLLGISLPLVVGTLVNLWFAGRADAVPLSPKLPNAHHLFVLGFTGALYLGLSALPVLVLRPGVVSRTGFLVTLVIMGNGAAICLAFGDEIFPVSVMNGGLFPYIENMITPWGTLESGTYVVGERPLMMGRTVQALLTVVGCIGGVALADRMMGWIQSGAQATPLVLFSAAHVIILLVSPTLYDRYFIVLMPGALSLAASAPFCTRWPVGIIVLALFAACSLGLMHDWLSWNSARWELGRRALARGIPADTIEGGLEWDSWYAPGPVAPEGPQPPPRGLMLPFNRRRFPHITGRYALAASQPTGTVVRDSQSFRLWLVPGSWRFLFVEQRGDGDDR